jgi:hypothetical protein
MTCCVCHARIYGGHLRSHSAVCPVSIAVCGVACSDRIEPPGHWLYVAPHFSTTANTLGACSCLRPDCDYLRRAGIVKIEQVRA